MRPSIRRLLPLLLMIPVGLGCNDPPLGTVDAAVAEVGADAAGADGTSDTVEADTSADVPTDTAQEVAPDVAPDVEPSDAPLDTVPDLSGETQEDAADSDIPFADLPLDVALDAIDELPEPDAADGLVEEVAPGDAQDDVEADVPDVDDGSMGTDDSSPSDAPQVDATDASDDGVPDVTETLDDVDTADATETVDDVDTFDVADTDDASTDTETDADTGPTCPGLNPLPLQYETLEGFTTGEDFAISPTGDYYANDGQNLVRRVGGEGPLELVVPAIGNTAGMGFLPGGDLVVANVGQGSLVRITPAGSQTTIISGLSYPNGLDIHWDGRIFVAEQSGGRVLAVDPDTGSSETVAEGICSPNGVSFSPGYDRVYAGSFGCGYVYVIEEEGTGWGPARAIGANGLVPEGEVNAPGIGTGGLDGLNTDECGNLYVTDFGPGDIYRIPADLSAPELAVTLPAFWIPNLHWGNGTAIWSPKVLYVAERSEGRLFALDIGVLGKETTAP